MKKKSYVPETGDIVWVDLSPTVGHEQRGRRPVLVVTQKSYNDKTGMMVACPMTTEIKHYPFEVLLSNSDENSVVLADQLRSLDWRDRNIEFIGYATDDELAQAKELIQSLLGL